MTRAIAFALCLLPAPLASAAQQLLPGLVSARLLPGWIDESGNRIAALELQLQPGWKTYWRSPGDTGLPPSFDWAGSGNLGEVTFHWPAPEAIRSGEGLTLGYHDLLILPFTAAPADPAQPVALSASVDFGLCDNICVPAHVELQAEAPGAAPDPQIEAALARNPVPHDGRPLCQVRDIDDGMQVSVDLPGQPEVAAMELGDRPDVWVSSAELAPSETGSSATADFVAPSGQPFDLNAADIRITLIGSEGAVEMLGCDPQG